MDTFEYLFFDPSLAEAFAAACREAGIPCEVEVGEQVNVKVDASVGETNQQELEALYDEYFWQAQAEQVEAEHDDFSATGIQVQLSNGEYTTIRLSPEVMNRLLSVFTVEELNQFMHEVAAAIENPNGGGTICEVLRREQKGS